MSQDPQPIQREIATCLGACIKRRRLLKKLTQAQLATRLNSMRSLVCRVESGLHVISLETLERYARALECLPSTLLREAERLADAPELPELPQEVAI